MRLLLLPFLLACGSDPQSEDSAADVNPLCEEGYDLNWDNFGHGFMLTYCTSCHSEESPNRFDAPEGVDFDTEQQLREQLDRVVYRVLEEETMPLGGGVFDDDLYLFEIYLECGL